MTIKLDLSEDISQKNDVYNFNIEDVDLSGVYGISWVSNEKGEVESRLKKIITYMDAKASIFILLTQNSWIEDSKIARYMNLSKYLQRNGSSVSNDSIFLEWILTNKNKIRHIGLIEYDALHSDDYFQIFIKEKYAYIIILNKNEDLTKNVMDFNPKTLLETAKLVEFIDSLGGALIFRVGGFDDPEKGFVGAGSKDMISRLLSISIDLT